MNRALFAFAVTASLITGCASTLTRPDDYALIRRDEQTARIVSHHEVPRDASTRWRR